LNGWRVALLDIDEETLNRSAADLHTDSVLPICCDVADAAGVTKAFSTVAQTFGRLDVLVNNAGIAIFKPILNITYEEWSRVLAVNQRCALQVASYGNMTTSRAVRSLLHQNSSRK
jgi:NAD(P)-dependent dehydrogenase (short-subunit alcohol dehydrogenase family)